MEAVLEGKVAVLSEVARRIKAKSYLEIGVRNPEANFDQVECPTLERKVGVDPNPLAHATREMTSDEFFKVDCDLYDLVFVDGDHTYEQVCRDALSSLDRLWPGGVIVFHDVWPESDELATMEHRRRGWCGHAFRAFAELVRRRDLCGFVLEMGHGLGFLAPAGDQSPKAKLPKMFEMEWLRERPKLVGLTTDFEAGWSEMRSKMKHGEVHER